MTCNNCEEFLDHEVSKAYGVISSNASYEKGNVVVKFDFNLTNTAEIEMAINTTGYSVTGKK